MEIIVQIVHWDDGSTPNRELRIYDMAGNSVGFGEIKLLDQDDSRNDTPQTNLFEPDVRKRSITYRASINIQKFMELERKRTEKKVVSQ